MNEMDPRTAIVAAIILLLGLVGLTVVNFLGPDLQATPTLAAWQIKETRIALAPKATQVASTGCSRQEYIAESSKHMQRIVDLMYRTNVYKKSNARNAINELAIILRDIRGMKCAKEFPLKQETLEDTAIHTTDALESVLDGDRAGMSDSFNSAISNAERFKNWSVDME